MTVSQDGVIEALQSEGIKFVFAAAPTSMEVFLEKIKLNNTSYGMHVQKSISVNY